MDLSLPSYSTSLYGIGVCVCVCVLSSEWFMHGCAFVCEHHHCSCCFGRPSSGATGTSPWRTAHTIQSKLFRNLRELKATAGFSILYLPAFHIYIVVVIVVNVVSNDDESHLIFGPAQRNFAKSKRVLLPPPHIGRMCDVARSLCAPCV